MNINAYETNKMPVSLPHEFTYSIWATIELLPHDKGEVATSQKCTCIVPTEYDPILYPCTSAYLIINVNILQQAYSATA